MNSVNNQTPITSDKLPEISSGEFNQLISQISGSSEFNKMISNLTSNLQESFSNLEPTKQTTAATVTTTPSAPTVAETQRLGDDNTDNTDKILDDALNEFTFDTTSTDTKNDDNVDVLESADDLVDILGLFFADHKGVNICETLIQMNQNFEKDLRIKEKLYSVLCQKWGISASLTPEDSDDDVTTLEKNFDEY